MLSRQRSEMSAAAPTAPLPKTADRRRWMRLFALADAARLKTAVSDVGGDVRMLRPPEIGLVMVRGRIGGGGAPFNLGEMPVVRCSVTLGDGAVGHAYVAGRDREKARCAAILDALMQCPDRATEVERTLLAPLEAEIAAQEAAALRKTAATRVDFFTLVRGD